VRASSAIEEVRKDRVGSWLIWIVRAANPITPALLWVFLALRANPRHSRLELLFLVSILPVVSVPDGVIDEAIKHQMACRRPTREVVDIVANLGAIEPECRDDALAGYLESLVNSSSSEAQPLAHRDV
jgi:hypothetical protein